MTNAPVVPDRGAIPTLVKIFASHTRASVNSFVLAWNFERLNDCKEISSMDVFWPNIPIWEIILRSLFVFVFLIGILRFTGKRDTGEMSPADLILLLLLSANVHTSLSGEDKSVLGGVIGATSLIAANYAFNWWAFKNKKFETFLKGSPELVVYKGRICMETLKKHHLTRSQLKMALRAEGLYRVGDVRLAVLEPDGTISVIET